MPAKQAPGASPASKVRKRLKLLVYGEPGTGKTALALSFGLGGKVLVIDLEGSTDLYEPGLQLHWGKIPDYDVVRSKNLDEILSLVDWLKSDKGQTYQTVVLEPVTLVWTAMQDVGQLAAETRAAKYGRSADDVTLTPRDWGKIKRTWRSAFTDLVNLPVNIVLTAHLREIMETKTDGRGNTTMVKVGERFDSEKNTGYWPDAIVKMVVENGKFVGVIEKVRGPGFEGLKTGSRVESLSYKHFAAFLDKHASGVEVVQQSDDVAAVAATKTAEKILAADTPGLPANATDEQMRKVNQDRFEGLHGRAARVGLAQAHGIPKGTTDQSQIADLLTVWADKIAAAESQAASQAA